jgi:hypothetical protein
VLHPDAANTAAGGALGECRLTRSRHRHLRRSICALKYLPQRHMTRGHKDPQIPQSTFSSLARSVIVAFLHVTKRDWARACSGPGRWRGHRDGPRGTASVTPVPV